VKLILDKIIRAYQLFISPFFASSCRFVPSCSEYAREAIAQHGSIKGLYLGLKRVARCHPWSEGGLDPVPAPGSKDKNNSGL